MEKHSKIFRAALILFGKYGLQKVNMQEIADSAGVSKKTLYNHFDGKEDLFDKTIQWHLNEIITFYQKLNRDAQTPLIEKFNQAVQYAMDTLNLKSKTMIKDLQRHNRYLNDSPISHIRKNIIEQITILVETGQNSGICRRDISADMISNLIILQLNGMLNWEGFDENSSVNNKELFNTSFSLMIGQLLSERSAREFSPEVLSFNPAI